MNTPTVTINFNPITLKPSMILPNGNTDTETAKILELVDKMLAAIEDGPEDGNVHT